MLLVQCTTGERHDDYTAIKARWSGLHHAIFTTADTTTIDQYKDQIFMLGVLQAQTFRGDIASLSTEKDKLDHIRARELADEVKRPFLYDFQRSVVALPKAYPVLLMGSYTLLDTTNPHILAYTASNKESVLLTILNMNEDNRAFKGKFDFDKMPLVAGNYEDGPLPVLRTSLLLRPFEGRIYVVR
jgi:hypothetical protein